MSRRSLGASRGLIAGLLLGVASHAHAASLEGRVVDSAGNGVAGAEVRVWQQAPGPDDNGITIQNVMFGDAEFVRTDADGRFQTPDVLAGDAFARVVVEQEGMLAARGEWIEVGKNGVTVCPDIIARRLVEVAGRVVDRQQRPVAEVTVFNSGDGNQRVETMSDAAGRFVLKGVPDGRIFLFAEKPGYRFTGMLWGEADGVPRFALSRIDEHIEPLRTLPPLLSRDEELALAHRLLQPYLAEVQESGAESSGYAALSLLAVLDPMEAFERAEAFHLQGQRRGHVQRLIVESCLRRGDIKPDDLQAIIESTEDEASIAYQYTVAAATVADRQRRLAWLDRASLHARNIEEPAARVSALAFVAEGLFAADDATAANTIVAECEQTALALPNSGFSASARAPLAFALAREKPRQAVDWLEGIKDVYYELFCGQLAIRLLSREPDLAEEIWVRAIERSRQGHDNVIAWWRYPQTPDFCYLMAGIDHERAERLARGSEIEFLRLRGLAAVAEAVRETDISNARKIVTSIVRDELSRLPAGVEPSDLQRLPPFNAAWMLPIVERLDPELGRECLWRALALKLPRRRRDHLNDEYAEWDGLAEMLARYDRGIARFLLEPNVARLPALSRASISARKSQHDLNVLGARGMIIYVTGTAAHIDPKWAGELVLSLPESSGESRFSPRNEAIESVVRTFSLAGDDRWTSPNAGSARFWHPPQK